MHYSLIVTFDKKEATNSVEARAFVEGELTNDPSFCGEGGRFSSPIADWFVIGGRWSGSLTKALLDGKKIDKFSKEFEKKHGWWTNSEFGREDRQEQALKLFKKHFPKFKGKMPFWRDTYKSDGYDDDAMILTEALYKTMLKEFEGSSQGKTHQKYEGYEWDDLHFIDLGNEEVSKKMIGKKWIVMVDYHN